MKLKLIAGLLLVTIIGSCSSCQNDDQNSLDPVSTEELKPTLVSIDEVMSIIKNEDIKNKINEITDPAPTHRSLIEDPEKAKYFEKLTLTGHYDQYSIFLKNYTPAKPYMLYYIVTVDVLQNEKSGYLKYIPEKNDLSLDMKNFSGKLQLLDNDMLLVTEATMVQGEIESTMGTTECVTSVVVVTHTCSHGGEHLPGEACNAGIINDAYYSFHVFEECWTTFGPGTPGDFIGGGGGGGGVSKPNTEIFTDQLTQTQKTFLLSNVTISDIIYEYIERSVSISIATKLVDIGIKDKQLLELLLGHLVDNNYSQNSGNFIYWATRYIVDNNVYLQESMDNVKKILTQITEGNMSVEKGTDIIEFLIDNGGNIEFDSSINPQNSLTFDTIEDATGYFNGSSENGINNVISETPQEILSETDFNLSGFSGVTVYIKQNKNPYSVTEVTSDQYGLTLGLEWTQTNSTQNTSGDVVTIDVRGTMKYVIFFEGIGTIYTQKLHFRIKINKTNGQIISSKKV